MAFELLFGQSSRQTFRDNIQKYSIFGTRIKLKTYNYPIVNTKTGRTDSHEQLTLNQIWAEEFYKLRHRIIHGDTVEFQDFLFADLLKIIKKHNPHFYIAVNFFLACVLNKLRELGFNNIPHFVINPDAKNSPIDKNISGIQNEVFKIQII